jgi:DNA ligase-1
MLVNGKDCLGMPMGERRRLLESLLSKNGLIRPSDRIIVNTPRELDVYFEKEVGDGLEGIVAKDLDAPYIAGARKFSWIKLKRSYKGELSDTIDLTIVGYYLGKGSRAEFEFGGLLAAVYNERRDVFETITKIGTGFTEEQMKSFKKLLSKSKVKTKPARVDSLMEPDFWVDPEYVVTVRADEITRSPMHTCGREESGSNETGFALRFPRITSDGVREDKKPEDSTTTKEIMELYASQKKTKVTVQGE